MLLCGGACGAAGQHPPAAREKARQSGHVGKKREKREMREREDVGESLREEREDVGESLREEREERGGERVLSAQAGEGEEEVEEQEEARVSAEEAEEEEEAFPDRTLVSRTHGVSCCCCWTYCWTCCCWTCCCWTCCCWACCEWTALCSPQQRRRAAVRQRVAVYRNVRCGRRGSARLENSVRSGLQRGEKGKEEEEEEEGLGVERRGKRRRTGDKALGAEGMDKEKRDGLEHGD